MGEIEVPEVPEPLRGTALLTVALIAIASITTGWCALQSALWGGRQTFAIMHANRDNVRATEAHLRGTQMMLLDVALFVQWLNASQHSEGQVAEFYARRFRPELEPAFDAWRRAYEGDPASAEGSPFTMPQYTNPERLHGDALAASSATATRDALAYNRTSDQYALMTVLLSMVSVLAGFAEKMAARKARRALFAVSLVFLTACLVRIVLLPIAGVG